MKTNRHVCGRMKLKTERKQEESKNVVLSKMQL